MKRLSTKQLIISSVVLWVVAAVILVWSWFRDIALPGIERWLLLPLILCIKDTLLYGYLSEPIVSRMIDWQQVMDDRDKQQNPTWYPSVLANRIYVFPVLLTIYLLYLLIEQTWLWWLQYSIPFLALQSDILLVLMIVSGIALLFGSSYDEQYQKKYKSKKLVRAYIALSVVLSILGGYIVLQQVLTLGVLWIVIANIAWYIIFLVGLVLLDEEEDNKNHKIIKL